MAITPEFLTGFEHGVASTQGTGLADTISAGCTVTTGSKRNGTYGLQIAASAAVQNFRKNLVTDANRKKQVMRFAVKISSYTSGNPLIARMGTAANNCYVYMNGSGTLVANCGGGTDQSSGVNINDGAWHVIEMAFDTSANPWKLDWKLDGVAQTQATGALATGAITFVELGAGAGGTWTATAFYDDWITGQYATAGGEWFNDGKVLAQVPGSDGSHNAAANQFDTGDTGGTNITNSSTTAWQMLDDVGGAGLPWTVTRHTTNNIRQDVVGTTNYLEIAPATTSETASANAVRALLAYSSTGTTANEGGCVARNSAGTEVEVFGTSAARTDYSESSNFFKGAIVTKPGAGWTPSEVNSVRWRIGYSNDISPIPTWQALMLEVDWPLTTPVNTTRTLQWDLQGAVTPTKQLKWDLIAQVATSKQLKWDLRGAVALGRQLKWDLLGAVALGRQLKWDLIAQVALARQLRWDLQGAVALARQLKWDLRGAVSALARQLKWDLLGAVALARQLRWDLFGAVALGRQAKWDLQGAIALGRQLQWDLRGAVALVQTLKWDLGPIGGGTPVNSDIFDLLWDLPAQRATTRALQWDLIAEVALARQARWDLRAERSAGRQLQWDLTISVTLSRQLQWNLRAAVALARQLRWDLPGFAAAARELRWDLPIAVWNYRQLKWSMLAHVTLPRQLRWDLSGGPALTRQLRWDLRTQTAMGRLLQWDLRAERARGWYTYWDLKAQRATGKQLQWTLFASAIRQAELKWNLIAQRTQARTLKWDLYVPRAIERTLSWHLRTIVAPSGHTAIWELRSPVSRPYALRWNLLAIIPPPGPSQPGQINPGIGGRLADTDGQPGEGGFATGEQAAEPFGGRPK